MMGTSSFAGTSRVHNGPAHRRSPVRGNESDITHHRHLAGQRVTQALSGANADLKKALSARIIPSDALILTR
jgi:hypothetical protein